MSIRIFAVGGTFDKEYNELNGALNFKATHLPEMLQRGRCRLNVDVDTLMMIDSLDMTESDREKVLENCQKTQEEKIVITHGTDTMPETAKVLGKTIKDKTIILTGAMVPFRFSNSDALFNLGIAIAFAQTLPHGVYVAMNGRYFPWDKVRKNKEKGEFEEIKD